MLRLPPILTVVTAMTADAMPLIAPIRRTLLDLQDRLATLRGYL
jgi:hypothetical protein